VSFSRLDSGRREGEAGCGEINDGGDPTFLKRAGGDTMFEG